MSINNVVLMGRLTSDVELKQTNSGLEVCNFCLAIDRSYQKEGEEKKTDFINCLAWRGTAKFISQYFNKGSMIAVTGSLQTSSYDDKDGNKRSKTEVLVNNVSFCGGKSQNDNGTTSTRGFDEISCSDDDDLPF